MSGLRSSIAFGTKVSIMEPDSAKYSSKVSVRSTEPTEQTRSVTLDDFKKEKKPKKKVKGSIP
jgi:hypothetical protein